MDALHTLNDDVDGALARLRERAPVWAAIAATEQLRLLSACRDRTKRCARQWTAIAAGIKGVSGMPASGEEALTGPWGTMRALDAYIETLRDVARYGRRRIDLKRVRRLRDGTTALRVFPNTLLDRFVLPGISAEVRLQPGATLENSEGERREEQAKVVAVMGAGNVTSIGVLDVLSKLVNDGAVCLLKLHPLLAPLRPVIDEVLTPLIDVGFVATACGDSGEGSYLCAHPSVDAVHVTGSTATYRAIAAETAKPVTAELGSVTPAIVLAGRWTEREIRHVAESLVTAKLHNDGFNCVALQILILPKRWPQRAALLSAIEHVMRNAPPRLAYYPGSAARFARLTQGRHAMRSFGRTSDGYVPPAIVEVDASDVSEPLFSEEVFCPLLAIATIDGECEEYLRDAVTFCNARLSGDLAAHLIAHPATLRDAADEIEKAVTRLRYGCVGLNLWCGVAFLLPQVPWGGAPGNTPERIGSGIGTVHNSLGISRPNKTVVRAPFVPFRGFARPPWFVTNRHAHEIAAALCRIA